MMKNEGCVFLRKYASSLHAGVMTMKDTSIRMSSCQLTFIIELQVALSIIMYTMLVAINSLRKWFWISKVAGEL